MAVVTLVLSLGATAWAGSPAEEAQKLIRKLTRDKDAEVRANAAERLGDMKAAEAVPALAAALKDKDRGVRASAAGALLDLGDAAKDAMPALQEALLDGDSTTVWNAAAALHNMGVVTTDLMPAYRRLLEDNECDMRISAANAIREYAPPADLLAVAFECRTTPARDFSDGDDVASLMRAIARDTGAIPAVTTALAHREWEVRQWAARALGDHGPKAKSAVPALTAALSDSDARVREAAEIALGKVVPKR
jgi:HEAT repeat protein